MFQMIADQEEYQNGKTTIYSFVLQNGMKHLVHEQHNNVLHKHMDTNCSLILFMNMIYILMEFGLFLLL